MFTVSLHLFVWRIRGCTIAHGWKSSRLSSITYVLGSELRLLGSGASIFTAEPSHQPCFLLFVSFSVPVEFGFLPLFSHRRLALFLKVKLCVHRTGNVVSAVEGGEMSLM